MSSWGLLPPSRAAGTAANLPSLLRVKFLALQGSEPVAQTEWSAPITLRTGTGAAPAAERGFWGGSGGVGWFWECGVVLGAWGGSGGVGWFWGCGVVAGG